MDAAFEYPRSSLESESCGHLPTPLAPEQQQTLVMRDQRCIPMLFGQVSRLLLSLLSLSYLAFIC